MGWSWLILWKAFDDRGRPIPSFGLGRLVRAIWSMGKAPARYRLFTFWMRLAIVIVMIGCAVSLLSNPTQFLSQFRMSPNQWLIVCVLFVFPM